MKAFLSALFDLFGQDCSLVLESSDPSPLAHSALSAISDHTGESGTVVSTRSGSGIRYELQLGREIPPELAEISAHHAVPEYCANAFVFRAGAPILLWFDFGSDPCIVRPEVEERLVRTLAERVGMLCQKIDK